MASALRHFIVGFCFWVVASGVSFAQQTQCISAAVAGGTADAITIPLQPCVPTTGLLMLTLTATNGTTTPTLQEIAVPVQTAQTIVKSDGSAVVAGYLVSGTVILLMNDGNKWRVLTTSPSVTAGITQLTGDVTAGPGSGSQVSTLAASGVAAGVYRAPALTISSKGLVTAASGGDWIVGLIEGSAP